MIAQRMSHMDSSGIRKIFDLAKNMKNPVNLSIGQPDFDVPSQIKNEAIHWIQKGFNQYTVTQGIPELREKLLEKLKRERGIEAEDILITSGVSGGIFLAFMALLNPGDEVIVPDPYFAMYKHLSHLMGASPVYIDTYPEFILTAEKISEKISKKTKLILINSPSNPTGVVTPQRELKKIVELAKKHHLVILSDEIYSEFSYDEPFQSIGRDYPLTLVLDGFSKTFAMTGWRLGFTAGPKEIIQAMTRLQQFSFVCAPSFAQKAALKALDCDMKGPIQEYRRKRDLIYEGLKEKFKLTRPGGAFYLFPQAPDPDGDVFVQKALEKNLLIIPGSVFSERKTHFRISFAAPNETLAKGIEILNQMV
ncbi:MAG: pyridoxal phosphate-dependent aminotransferase [Chlamydiae bacterium]|nr:pyridoxal phosphate-dependent aminotransferase [Chlamydiota bacterium]MBI3265812.1 pyridoxal phosphate-dependent aminotransferase [Chlamydiota bacterium]